MTFIPELGVAVIRIPKTGGSALEQVINERYDPKQNLCQGHKTALEIANELIALGRLDELREFVVVLRDPLTRFVSALNHLHGRKEGHDINRAMSNACNPSEHHKILFKPQHEFLNLVRQVPYRIFSYSDDGVDAAAKYLECRKPDDVNVSVKRFDIDHVTSHADYDRAYGNRYKLDESMWTSVTLSGLYRFDPKFVDTPFSTAFSTMFYPTAKLTTT